MPDHRDVVLVEQAKIQRARLTSALLHGRVDERRTVNDNMRRLVASIILTAVVSAGCVGVSFVSTVLADQAAARQTPTPTRIEETP